MFAGAMLTIGVTLGGYWKSLPASEFLDPFSQNNRFIMQVIPLVVVPTLLGLAGSLWLGWSEGEPRVLWIGATLSIVAVLVVTVAWFVPTNGAIRGQVGSLGSGAPAARCQAHDPLDSYPAGHRRVGARHFLSPTKDKMWHVYRVTLDLGG